MEALPKSVELDMKWFIWNELWYAFNRAAGVEQDAQDDKRKSNKHYKALLKSKTFSDVFFKCLRAHTQDSGTSVLKVTNPRSLGQLQVVPSDTSAELWSMLVEAVHLAAAAMVANYEGLADQDEKMECFDRQIELSCTASQRSTTARGHALTAMEPLAGWNDLVPEDSSSESDGLIGLGTANEVAPQVQQSAAATALQSSGGPPIAVGSMGWWLDSMDFVVACSEGMLLEVHSAFDIGIHGSIRQWQDVKNTSVLKSLLRKTGPLQAETARKVGPPSVEYKLQASDLSLQPLQSYANARAIKRRLGLDIVKGWVIYDLFSMDVGAGYLAERYWWNATKGDQSEDGARSRWLDFTPHPEWWENHIVLVKSMDDEVRLYPAPLTYEQLVLAESFYCLRFPEAMAPERTGMQLGTPGAFSTALRQALELAEEQGVGAVRRVMANACLAGATSEHLSGEDGRLPLMDYLVGWLEEFTCLTGSDDRQERALESFLERSDAKLCVSMIMTYNGDIYTAATAASALACACYRNPQVQASALAEGAPEALADLSKREALQRMDSYAAEAANVLWEVQPRVREQEHEAMRTDHWEGLLALCNEELRDRHASQPPRERRGSSWARTLAFAQVALGASGIPFRRGTTGQPFTVWVLGATDPVEGFLAREGYFQDANWVEWAPTRIILLGKGLCRYSCGNAPKEGGPAAVLAAPYADMQWMGHFGVQFPDMVMVYMPESGMEDLPEDVLAVLSEVPTVVSRPFFLPRSGRQQLRHRVEEFLIMPQVHCPFSGSAATADLMVDDNSWIFAVQGAGLRYKAFDADFLEDALSALPFLCEPCLDHASRVPVAYWGILDIKYDTAMPVLDRVKILETGSGQSSKFSQDGAAIKLRFDNGYYLDTHDSGLDHEMTAVVSADKKLTHDLIKEACHEHLIPKQVCFPRQYRPGLAQQIRDELGLGDEDDKLVLKLCNRTRGAGVIVTPASELDKVLEDLLQPPANLEEWLEAQEGWFTNDDGAPLDLGIGKPYSFEEQRRHWWSNESPVFLAEAWCKSVPTVKDGQPYDGTMRVAFALRRPQQSPPEVSSNNLFPNRKPFPFGPQPVPEEAPEPVVLEDLVLDWLGAYWKLPEFSMHAECDSLRDCIVSMAKRGTAPVGLLHHLDVLAALGDVVQRLHGSPPPRSQLARRYTSSPLGAFVTARLAMASKDSMDSAAEQMLGDADGMLSQMARSRGRANVQSFVHRAQGHIAVIKNSNESRSRASEHFQSSLQLLPTSANALHRLGLHVLERDPCEAVKHLRRSLLLDPDYKGAYVNLGMAYLGVGSWERAVRVSQAGYERHPDEPRLAYHMGVAYSQQALDLVNHYADLSRQEMAMKREAEESRAKQAEKEASDNFEKINQMHRAAMEEKVAAQTHLNNVMAKSRSHEIVEGTALKCMERIAIWKPCTGNDWNEIGTLKADQKVKAAGQVTWMDKCPMVPIQDPKGFIDPRYVKICCKELEEAKAAIEQAEFFFIEINRMRDEEKNRVNGARKGPAPVPIVRERPVSELIASGEDAERYEQLRTKAYTHLTWAREHAVSKTRRKPGSPPYLEADDLLIAALDRAVGPVVVKQPAIWGWQSSQFRW